MKIAFIIMLSAILSLFIQQAIIPAHHSYILACQPKEKTEVQGLAVAGLTSYNPKTEEISVQILVPKSPELSDERKRVIKHEYVHVKQAMQDRITTNCINYPRRMINEVEAYLGEDLPDKIYDKIYGGGWREIQ